MKTLWITILIVLMSSAAFATITFAGHQRHCVPGTEVVVWEGEKPLEPEELALAVFRTSGIPVMFVRWMHEHALFNINKIEFYHSFEKYLTGSNIQFERRFSRTGIPIFGLPEFNEMPDSQIDLERVAQQVTAYIGIPVTAMSAETAGISGESKVKVFVTPNGNAVIDIYMNLLAELSGGEVAKVQWSEGVCHFSGEENHQ